jgi:hypothetical protein
LRIAERKSVDQRTCCLAVDAVMPNLDENHHLVQLIGNVNYLDPTNQKGWDFVHSICGTAKIEADQMLGL